GQISLTVAVEVARRHETRPRSNAVVNGGLECTVAFSQQHRHIARGKVCHGQVGLAVTVEVSDGYGRWASSSSVVDRGMKSAVAVAQQHRHTAVSVGPTAGIVVTSVRQGQVGFSIAIEVAYRYGVRRDTSIVNRGQERAIALA